jgi:hypothetical protein
VGITVHNRRHRLDNRLGHFGSFSPNGQVAICAPHVDEAPWLALLIAVQGGQVTAHPFCRIAHAPTSFLGPRFEQVEKGIIQ